VQDSAGGRGKKRPAFVIRAYGYNHADRYVIVAEITSNLSRATDPANLLIDLATPEDQATGLAHVSVVTCLQLATISEDRSTAVIGKLSAATLANLNACLVVVLDIP
jgi:mRNA-degrading endonuclease toxin of MazEF toxin-antitoxin module